MRNRLRSRLMLKYAEGFQDVCDLLGVDAVALVKEAQIVDQFGRAFKNPTVRSTARQALSRVMHAMGRTAKNPKVRQGGILAATGIGSLLSGVGLERLISRRESRREGNSSSPSLNFLTTAGGAGAGALIGGGSTLLDVLSGAHAKDVDEDGVPRKRLAQKILERSLIGGAVGGLGGAVAGNFMRS